ncbi:D-serine deaminase-like pyridoxal phosphate-dependent protein [Nonomuraea muscovyensis]|uniref:D-serine deaminase-like pyridoxal phosphate-dependent protein n=1 Tax=Nonomuraea muscovyensis TaxID=1124761 RepID=A0A7X0F173_9ACTN|nr:alanine racemase [Nonomuraea muscovyensis]MBB6351663.1 D-serine deaminase-like pyridoxal phosphate-dependent protein [Nonomuraea muscovyensis]
MYPELDTPALLIDLDVVRANVAEMAKVAATHGVALRPHIKTHKMPELARLQLEAGATGITCAKLGEAEIMADAGVDDILLAFPLWGEPKLRRLAALRERARVRVSLDSPDVAAGLGRLGLRTGSPVEVLVEVDTGQHRLGRPPGRPTADLVAEIAAIPGIEVVGLLTLAGHAYHARTPDQLAEVSRREGTDLVATAELCARDGIELPVISVGCTPTARYVAAVAGVTEIRPGTYIFNDTAMMRLGVATEETAASRVLATVVARPSPDRVVLDAGTKCLTSDGAGTPAWIRAAGLPWLRMDFLNEEHAVARLDPEHARDGELPVGTRVQLIPGHACPVTNLFDVAHGVEAGRVTTELRVAARGAVR